MRKVQFFVIVETILLVMGLMTIMANNLSSFNSFGITFL